MHLSSSEPERGASVENEGSAAWTSEQNRPDTSMETPNQLWRGQGLCRQKRWQMPDADGNAGRAETGIAESAFRGACVLGVVGIYFNQI